jgi:NAD(P)-dependent dehydrogenase (short-subunit alcohol dehydrogenase family)
VVTVSSIAAMQRDLDFNDANAEHEYKPMRAYGVAKLAQLMFAVELDRRSRSGNWAVMSNAAHPGLAKTGLLSGASYGRDEPTLANRLTKWTWHLLPFMWLDIDEAIKPTLYAATSPHAAGGTYYGPRGLYQTAGGGVTFAKVPRLYRNEGEARLLWQLSEQLTGVTYPLAT